MRRKQGWAAGKSRSKCLAHCCLFTLEVEKQQATTLSQLARDDSKYLMIFLQRHFHRKKLLAVENSASTSHRFPKVLTRQIRSQHSGQLLVKSVQRMRAVLSPGSQK